MRHPLIALALAAPLALFLYWTWLRVWRPATDQYSRTVYLFGVKGFGLIMFAMTLWDRTGEGSASLLLQLYADVLAILPISLWGGYWFGRGMAWAFNQEPRS